MKTGKSEMTKSILHHVFKNKEFHCCLQRVKAMQLNGQYLMDTNAETFEIVFRKYFMGSLDLLDKYDKSKGTILQKYPNLFTLEEFNECQAESKKSAYEIIAKYADREYTQVRNGGRPASQFISFDMCIYILHNIFLVTYICQFRSIHYETPNYGTKQASSRCCKSSSSGSR